MGSPRMHLTVVIAVRDRRAELARCLAAIAPQAGPDCEIIVVDNGSHDDTPAGLARLPWVTTIPNATNRGFATACNQGAALAVRQRDSEDPQAIQNLDPCRRQSLRTGALLAPRNRDARGYARGYLRRTQRDHSRCGPAPHPIQHRFYDLRSGSGNGSGFPVCGIQLESRSARAAAVSGLA